MDILVNDVVQDIEAIHGILFAAKNRFRNAIMERPTVPGLKDNPKLYDGEKLLLAAIDIAIGYAEKSVQRVAESKLVSPIRYKCKRAENNYTQALQRQLAKKTTPIKPNLLLAPITQSNSTFHHHSTNPPQPSSVASFGSSMDEIIASLPVNNDSPVTLRRKSKKKNQVDSHRRSCVISFLLLSSALTLQEIPLSNSAKHVLHKDWVTLQRLWINRLHREGKFRNFQSRRFPVRFSRPSNFNHWLMQYQPLCCPKLQLLPLLLKFKNQRNRRVF